MKVYRHISEFKKLPHAVVTSGTFDGVHLGHRKIIDRLIEIAAQEKGESVVITFWPHPRLVIQQPTHHNIKVLTTLDEKITLLEKAGIQHLFIIPFTKEFSELSSENFIQDILISTIGTKTLVIGYDHRFGKNREGGFESLKANEKKHGFRIEEIPRQDIDHETISSTAVRNALSIGDVKAAADLLGYPYSLTGKVIHGKKLGRKIGYPTANLQIQDLLKLVPADGIYAVKILINTSLFLGMLSIGNNPTIPDAERSIEVNIFDFNEDLYDKFVEIHFIEWLRSEEKFDGLESLIAQLKRDEEQSRKILS